MGRYLDTIRHLKGTGRRTQNGRTDTFTEIPAPQPAQPAAVLPDTRRAESVLSAESPATGFQQLSDGGWFCDAFNCYSKFWTKDEPPTACPNGHTEADQHQPPLAPKTAWQPPAWLVGGFWHTEGRSRRFVRGCAELQRSLAEDAVTVKRRGLLDRRRRTYTMPPPKRKPHLAARFEHPELCHACGSDSGWHRPAAVGGGRVCPTCHPGSGVPAIWGTSESDSISAARAPDSYSEGAE